MARHLRRLAALPALALGLVLALGTAFHTGLQRATPGDGDSLAAVPETLALTFTGAVDPALATVRLVGPDGADVGLAPPERPGESARELVARITGPLAAGTHVVHWQVVGADGHPVRGEFSFEIQPDAEGLVAAVVQPDPPPVEPAAEAPPPSEPAAFGADSPLYVGVRWLTFLGLLGAIGTVAFRMPVLSLVRRRGGEAAARLVEPAARTAAAVGIGAAGVLVVALVLRLFAQSYAVFGAGPFGEGRLGLLLGRSLWGWGWMLQAVGVLAALAGFAVARRGSRAGWVAAGAATVVLAFSTALSGHAAASDSAVPAMAAHALHLLGAGGWLGSLLAVVLVGIPVALRLPAGERGAAVRSLVNAFSPTALAFAGVVVATGLFATWLHLPSFAALRESAYGQTLLWKLAVLTVVFGAGAYNWLRVRPALGEEAAAHRLRRSATLELAAGALVLAITAVLVATPPPAETGESPALAAER